MNCYSQVLCFVCKEYTLRFIKGYATGLSVAVAQWLRRLLREVSSQTYDYNLEIRTLDLQVIQLFQNLNNEFKIQFFIKL